MRITADHTAARSLVRVAIATACLLLVPLVAMQFTEEVKWTASDFMVGGAMLFGAGITYELIARKGGLAYRAAIGLAAGTALLLVWVNLAVGLIGSESNPANLVYAGVLAVEIIGAFIARLAARGMARALFATAGAQAVVGALALTPGFGGAENGPLEIVLINGFFAVLFAIAGMLFRRAAGGA
jgi:hypothetical protein